MIIDISLSSGTTEYLEAATSDFTHLICEKDFDGEAAGPWGDILHRNGVIGIGNDIKVDVFFFIAEDVGVTLDSHTDITCSIKITVNGTIVSNQA